MAIFNLTNLTFLAAGVALGFALQTIAEEPQKPMFTPKPGGVAVLYSHQFKQDKWKEARKMFQTHFYKEIKADHKDIRDSFILESPEKAEILGVTLWRSKKDLDDWESQRERSKHLKELDPFRSRPMEETRFRIMDEIIE